MRSKRWQRRFAAVTKDDKAPTRHLRLRAYWPENLALKAVDIAVRVGSVAAVIVRGNKRGQRCHSDANSLGGITA